jgi:hypothetical protein
MNKTHEIDFNFSEEKTLPCRIADGWDNAGKTGQYFGNIMVNDIGWAIILWDGEEDPDMYKMSGIEINKPHWVKVNNI